MEVTVSNVLKITNPTEMVREWCDKHLDLPNPDYAKKVRLGFSTKNTPKRICLYEQDGDTLFVPFGMLREIGEIAPKDTTYISDFPEPVLVNYGSEHVDLHKYQEDAVAAMHQAKYGILQSPAGSGKTQMGISLVKKFGVKALWITHTADLLSQTYSRATRYIDKSLIGTITQGKVNIGPGFTIATVQTLSQTDLSKYQDTWDLIIVDECHRCSGTPTKVTQYYKVLSQLRARHKIGLSATVHRADGMIKCTYSLLGEVAHVVSDDEVSETVVKVGIQAQVTRARLSPECYNPDGTMNYTKTINYLTQHPLRNRILMEEIEKCRGYSTLILSDRLAHLEYILENLPEDMQKDAVMITGKMTSKSNMAKRTRAIEDMRTGKKKVLLASYNLAKEGLDIPRLERLVMATPQKDFAIVTQCIGRIARKFEGKADPVAYDFVDNFKYAFNAYRLRTKMYKKMGLYFLPLDDRILGKEYDQWQYIHTT